MGLQYESKITLPSDATRAGSDCEVLVVGAGPAGLLTTLLLAQSGISVILIEALPDIDNSPRAMAYGPAAVVELERAGVAAEARSVGMDPDDRLHCVRWINIEGEVIGEFLPEDKIPVSLALTRRLRSVDGLRPIRIVTRQ